MHEHHPVIRATNLRQWVWLPALLTCALAAPSPALASWPNDPTVNVPVCTEDYDQEFPALLPDGAGGAYVVWQDYRSGSDYKIYAQRYSADGDPQWGTNGIRVCYYSSGDQLVPHITSDGAGGAIITWNDSRAVLTDIYCQRLAPDGTPLWDPDGVPLCTAEGPQHDETLVPDGAGGAIVTWWDRRDDPTHVIGDIYAQRVDTDGNPIWSLDGVPICVAAGSQQYPMIVSDGSGGGIITWVDARNGDSNRDIYVQRVDAAGNRLWTTNGVVLCNAANDQTSTGIVSDDAGGAIVSWDDARTADRTYAQRISSAGIVQWAGNGVPLDNNFGEIFPAIVADGAGGAIVTWTDFRNFGTSAGDVYAQRISATGTTPWGAAGIAVCTFSGDQYYPTITTDGAGGAIITWQDQRVDAFNSDVFARHVTAGGTVLWSPVTGGVAVSTADYTQYLPVITRDGSGGAIVAWMDARNGTTDIYAQRILSDGSLGGSTVGVPTGSHGSSTLDLTVPNPARGGRLFVRFSLPHAGRGSLELLDVAGRRIAWREVVGPAVGSQALELGATHIPPGLYLVRLRQGDHERVTRVAVLE